MRTNWWRLLKNFPSKEQHEPFQQDGLRWGLLKRQSAISIFSRLDHGLKFSPETVFHNFCFELCLPFCNKLSLSSSLILMACLPGGEDDAPLFINPGLDIHVRDAENFYRLAVIYHLSKEIIAHLTLKLRVGCPIFCCCIIWQDDEMDVLQVCDDLPPE